MKNLFSENIIPFLPDIIIRNKQIKCFTGGWLIMNMEKEKDEALQELYLEARKKRKSIRPGEITGTLEVR